MKRFASLVTTAALAGSLFGARTAAQANSTMSLVPVSSITGIYKAGDTISVAVVLTLGTGSFGSFLVPTAVGYVNSQFDDPSADPAIPPSYGPDLTAKFTGPKAGSAGGTTSYTLWSFNAPSVSAPTRSKIKDEMVQSAQANPGHGKTVETINGVKTTLAVPAGTYTLATFAFAVASTYTSGPLSLYLTTPNGFADASNDADGAFAGGVSTYKIDGATNIGVPVSEPLSFPISGKTLTFNGGAPVPAPAALAVFALGAIPLISVLRKRRKG